MASTQVHPEANAYLLPDPAVSTKTFLGISEVSTCDSRSEVCYAITFHLVEKFTFFEVWRTVDCYVAIVGIGCTCWRKPAWNR